MTEHRPDRDEHPAIRARRDLADLASLYPVLIRSLVRGGGVGQGRVTGSPETPLPYRENVSAMLGEVRHLAHYLAQRLVFESDPKRPIRASDLPDLPDELLALVSRDLIGHFAPDTGRESEEFARDIASLAKRAELAAYPVGSRWIDVPNRSHEGLARRDPMPCAEPGCAGRYRMRLAAESRWGITVADPHTWPPLTCSAEAAHIVTGVELERSIVWARANGTTHLDELRKWRAA